MLDIKTVALRREFFGALGVEYFAALESSRGRGGGIRQRHVFQRHGQDSKIEADPRGIFVVLRAAMEAVGVEEQKISDAHVYG